jgi:hypothetical protein
MIDALAWPAVGLVLGLVGIAAFRGPIVRKIDRITRASREGVSFERQQDPDPPKSETQSFAELMNLPISATVLAREKVVAHQLTSLPLKTDAERIAVMQRVVASVNVDLEFTRIAHIIFGSQLNFLVQLAGTRNGLPKAQAEAAYTAAVGQFPDFYKERPFEQWLGYMVASGLVQVVAENLDITQYGSDFLKFLVDARLAYDRYG